MPCCREDALLGERLEGACRLCSWAGPSPLGKQAQRLWILWISLADAAWARTCRRMRVTTIVAVGDDARWSCTELGGRFCRGGTMAPRTRTGRMQKG